MPSVAVIIRVRRHQPYYRFVAHRYRAVANTDQSRWLARHCSDTRFVKNALLEQFKLYNPALGATPGPAERMRELADARQALPWLREGSSAVQQQAVRDFDRAVASFFAGTHGYPCWWRRGIHESFTVRDVKLRRYDRHNAAILVPKCGWVRFRLSRPLPAEHGMARFTMDRAGRWQVSFAAPQPIMLRAVTGQTVGIDLGVKATITTSDGERLRAPAPRASEQQRLRRLERRKARQRKGSNRRERTKRCIARWHVRQADRRKDFIEQTSTRLVRENDVIVLEDLKIKSMVRSARGTVTEPGSHVRQKAGLNRSIHQQGWAMLSQRIQDKAATCGVQVIAVSAAYTSQKCSGCGHTAPENRESQADFRCVACGHRRNADHNAAINILAAGTAVTGRGGTAGSSGPDEASISAVAA